MDNNGIFGEILEKGQNTTKNAISDTANSVKGQIGIKSTTNNSSGTTDGFSGALKSQVGIQNGNSKPTLQSDGFTGAIKSQIGPSDGNNQPSGSGDGFTDVIKDQVGISSETGNSNKSNSRGKSDWLQHASENNERTKEVVSEYYESTEQPAKETQTQEQINTKVGLAQTREELQKFADLHKQVYYDPLFDYENKKPNKEETASERVEKQEMEDLQQSQKKQENMTPVAVQRAQTSTEVNRGVAG